MNRIIHRIGAAGLAVAASTVLTIAPSVAGPQTDPPPPLPVGFVPVCLLPFTNIIIGTPGPDELVGTSRNDLIIGLGGADVIHGGGGRDSIYGGAGPDKISGDEGDDCIIGGPGMDATFRLLMLSPGTDQEETIEARYEY